MVLLQLTSPSNIVQLHLYNIMAIALSERWEGPDSQLCVRSLLLWHQAIQRKLTLLPPLWLTSEENMEADFPSRHSLKR